MTAVRDLQVMPDLEADVDSALRDSIRSFGVLIPIVVTQDGDIIDGHNRWRLAAELNVSCPQTVRIVESEAEALELARTLNLDRRHLDSGQRAQLAHSLRERGHSLRAIAGALGVHHSTIADDLSEVTDVELSDSPTVTKITGEDGKQRPAQKRRWTTEDLAELLAEHEAGASVTELANTFGLSTSAMYKHLRSARQLAVRTAPAGGSAPIDRTPDAVAARESKVRELAASGHTSRQIATTLGINVQSVTSIAKRIGVEVPADAVVGKKTHRHDSNRIVGESALALEGIVSSLDLAVLDDLEPEQITDWVASIARSVQEISRFNKRLKEHTHGR